MGMGGWVLDGLGDGGAPGLSSAGLSYGSWVSGHSTCQGEGG
jgi:hypothetical protein